jgi:RNA polymerase sigma-70 factor (ECF subfamily)
MSPPNTHLCSTDGFEAIDLAAVVRRHGRDIERWAARLGGPLVDAEDVAQEVLLVVQRRLRDFRPEAQLSTWLYKITQNIATSRRRRERLRRWLRGLPLDYARDLPDPELSAAEVMEQREAAAEVYAALDMLAESYRSIVILFEIEGLSGEEIAALTGVPIATVWVRLHRGRRKFRAHYEGLLAKRGEP